MRQSRWRIGAVLVGLAALTGMALSVMVLSRGLAGPSSAWKDRQDTFGSLTALCPFGTPSPSNDTDSDGLDDVAELSLGTGPCDPDSDDDTLLDGSEVNGVASPKPTLGTFITDPLDADTDDDTCTDGQELGDNQNAGGRRDPTNQWDYFNPTKDGQNRIDDVLAVLGKYFVDVSDPPSYSTQYDRTYLGPNPWNLGPPNGMIRIDDVLAALNQYFHDCG